MSWEYPKARGPVWAALLCRDLQYYIGLSIDLSPQGVRVEGMPFWAPQIWKLPLPAIWQVDGDFLRPSCLLDWDCGV